MATVNYYPVSASLSFWQVLGTSDPIGAAYDGDPATLYGNIYPANYPSDIQFYGGTTPPANFVGSTINSVTLYIWTDPQMANRGAFTPYIIRAGTQLNGTTQQPFTGGQAFTRPGGGSWVYTDFYTGTGFKWGVAGAGNADDNSKACSIYEIYIQINYTPATAPVAAFTVSTTTGTAPLTVQFTDQGTNTPTSWLWTFGDGNTSSSQHPLYVYTTVGTYTVTLTETNGGGSDDHSTANLITVLTAAAPVDAAFNASPLSGVQNLGVQFTDYSQGTPAPSSWSWNFGDGATSTEQHPLHIYTTVGTYTVTLTASNVTPTTDTTTAASFITVANGKPVPAAAASTTTGVRDLSVQFTGSATNAVPTTWSWDFGDNGSSVAQSPLHVYTTVGTYTPVLTVGNAIGTASTTVGPITVGFETITATFSGGPLMGYVPMTSRFTDESLGDAFSWQWDFSDGSGYQYGPNPVHVYTTNSITEVSATLTVTLTSMSHDPTLRHDLTNYWDMEEVTGTGTRADSIGSVALTPTASATQITGKCAYGVTLPVNVDLDVDTGLDDHMSAFSYDMWIQFSSLPATTEDVAYFGGDVLTSLKLFRNTANLGIALGGTSETDTGSTNLSAATWYHIVVTFDGVSLYRLYINTVLEAAIVYAPTDGPTGFTLLSGAVATLSVDAVGRYDKALTQDQIEALYAAGVGNCFHVLAISDAESSVLACPLNPDRTWGYFLEEMKYQLVEPMWDQNVCEGFDAFGGIYKTVKLVQQRLQRFVLETRALRKEATLGTATTDTEDFDLPTDLIELLRVEVDGVPFYPADPYQRDRDSMNNVYILNDARTITLPGVFGTTPTVKVFYTFVPPTPTVPTPCSCPEADVEGPWTFFPLPYVLWWIIRYGVIADMLNQPGERNDPVRAGEAEKLWSFGVEVYKTLYRGSE